MKRYTSSLDAMTKGLTWFIIALAVIIAFSEYFGIRLNMHDIKPYGAIGLKLTILIPVVLLPGTVIAMYLFKTTGIVVDENAITIERMIMPVVINFAAIVSVKRIDRMKYVIRTCGNGGLFGYTGFYYKSGIGTMRWYCTQRTNYILIEKTNGKKLVITPDDPDGFMNDIAAKHPALVINENVNPAA